MAAFCLVFAAALQCASSQSLEAGLVGIDGATQSGVAEVALGSGNSMVLQNGRGEAGVMRHEPLSAQKARTISAHVQEEEQGLLEVSHDHSSKTDPTTTNETMVSCGAHRATRCRLCTVIDPETKAEIADQGPSWCHGQCIYYDGECHDWHAGNLHAAREQANASTTKPLPDLMNPNITAKDKEIMEEGAKRAIQEADYEAKMRLAAQKQHEEEEADTGNKFTKYAMVSFAACLALCAVGSCCMLCHFMRGPQELRAGKRTYFQETQDASADDEDDWGPGY